MKRVNLKATVTIALFAALISVGSYLTIPMIPIPVTLQSLFVLLAGFLLGPRRGAGAVAVFLLLGSLGLPVFSGGTAGLGTLAGPTGGYLAGLFLAPLAMALIPKRTSLPASAAAACVGTVAIFVPGVAWLSWILQLSLKDALIIGVLPFIMGDLLKIILAVVLSRLLHTRLTTVLDDPLSGIDNSLPREGDRHP